MAIIDQLMITLGMDTSGVKKGTADAKRAVKGVDADVQKTTRTVKDFGRAGSDAFVSVNKSAAAFLATLGGTVAIKNFIRDTTDSTANLSRFSRNIGENANSVSAWGQAVEQAGGTASGLQSTLAMLSQAQTELALTGNTSLLPFFAALGINMSDANGKARSTMSLLLDVSSKLQGMERPRAFNILRMMNVDEGTANAILQGPQALQKLINDIQKTTAVTDDQAKKAEAVSKEWTKVKQQFQAVGRELTISLSPAMIDLAKSFTDLARQAGPPLASTLQSLVKLNQETDGAVVKAGIALLAFKALGGRALVSSLLSVASAVAQIGTAAAVAAGGGVAKLARGLGVVGAGLAGYGIGSYIYENHLSGTETGNDIGRFVAGGMAMLGSKDAQAALDAERRASGASINGTTYGRVTAPISSPAHFFSELEKKHGLPSGMLDRMWQVESGRGRNMVSPKGATGHFQFMPGTASDMGLSRADTFDLQKSASAAAQYMGMLIKRYGSVEKALAAYNFGMGNIDRGRPQPLETRNYVAQIAPYVGSPRASSGAGGGNTSVTVGQLTVNTQATDAQGIANDIVNSLDFAFASQADYGVTP